MVETFAIDAVAPTIAARQFPSPFNGWHLTPVTVQFQCLDNFAVANCPFPITVSAEGAGQVITGTATDTVGLQATVTETLNLDLTPPVLAMTSPEDGSVTTDTTIVITGSVSDELSGVASVKCNGVETALVDGQVSCSVALRPGRNTVSLSARDMAGNAASAVVNVSRVGSAPTALTLSPALRRLVVNEQAALSLRDAFGVSTAGALWSSSDPAVVALSADDPPTLTALAEGSVTISAEKDGFTASSVISVFSTELASGELQWRVQMPPTPNQLEEAPIFANPVEASGPDVFTIAADTATGERTVWPVSTETGESHAMIAAPGTPLLGDTFGGLIAGAPIAIGVRCDGLSHGSNVPDNGAPCYSALVRFAGPANTASWRYESRGVLERPAQAPDGTIFVVERAAGEAFNRDRAVLILDGATGAVRARVPLANTTSNDTSDLGCMYGDNGSVAPKTIGPIVGGDGFGYLLVEHHSQLRQFICSSPQRYQWYEYFGTTNDSTLRLLRFSPDGLAGEHLLQSDHHFDDWSRDDDNWYAPSPNQLVPDGVGGVLGLVRLPFTGSRVFRLDDQLNVTNEPWSYGRIELIGQNGTAYTGDVNDYGQASFGKHVVDVRTRQTKWTLPLDWNWIAAGFTGDTFAERNGAIARFGPGGQRGPARQLNLANPVYAFGSILGQTAAGLKAFAEADSYDATLWDSSYGLQGLRGFGTPQRQLAARKPCALCQKDYHAPSGKGPASTIPGVPATDNRRIITVSIDGSWDTAPGSGETHPRIWGATACAVQMWNLAEDPFGNKTGFYIVMDQLRQRGVPDVVVKDGLCSEQDGAGGWACSAFPFNDAAYQTEMMLPRKNVNSPGITDEMLCGRVAHELAHKLGGHGKGACYMQSTILYGLDSKVTGQRSHNSVTPVDVEIVNQALNQPASCTGDSNNISEPAEEIASHAVDRPSFSLTGVAVAVGGFQARATTVRSEPLAGRQMHGLAEKLPVLLIVSIVAMVFVSCGRGAPSPPPQSMATSMSTDGYLARLASMAKAKGLLVATYNETIERDTSSGLDDALLASSVLLATPTGMSQVTSTPDRITTWEQLRVDEWIRRGEPPVDADYCRSAPPAMLTKGDGVLAVPMAKGTTTISDVSITVLTQSTLVLAAGQQYLFLVKQCPNQDVRLAYGLNSVFLVSKDGRFLLPAFNEPTAPFVTEVIDLQDLDGLRRATERTK